MQSDPTDLTALLCATVTKYALFAPGRKVVVGVSGGPDSAALLHALVTLRDEWNLHLVAAHLNHGIRGEEADADADYVRDLCARLDVECVIERADVPQAKRRQHLSTQEAARNARHAFLRRVAQRIGTEETTRIALAHTRDDRVETVLMNLMRGTGLDGLSGFPPVDLPVVRPLYDVSRAQVEAYCALYKLEPRRDSSNTDTHYLRNRVRHELLPELRAHYNPQVNDALLRLADIAGEEERWLHAHTAQTLAELATAQTEENIVFPLPSFNLLPLALRRRVLRQAILQVRGTLENIPFARISRVLDAAEQERHYSVELPAAREYRVCLECDSERMRVFRSWPSSTPLPWHVTLNVPGQTALAGAGVRIHAFLCTANELPDLLSPLPTAIFRSNSEPSLPEYLNTFLALFRREDVTLPLVARSWQSGDRIRPRNLGGSKKLQDLYTDTKIPAGERNSVPVVVDTNDEGRVLLVGGLRADEHAVLVWRAADGPETLNERLRREIQGENAPESSEYLVLQLFVLASPV